MKIALCAPADIASLGRSRGEDCSGVALGLGSTATTPLIIEFLQRGHDVTLYTLSKGLTEAKEYRWANLRVVVGPFRERHLASTYYRPEIGFLQRAIKSDAPAFVHAHWTYEFALAALRAGAPTVTTIHDLPWNVLRSFRDPHRVVRLLMAYEVGLRGQQFTAVSQGAACHFSRFFKPGAKIQIIPNGLPSEIFAMGRMPRTEPDRLITFATVLQGWSRGKNPKTALKAFHSVRDRIPSARLMMFGCGYELDGHAHQWAKREGLDLNVCFAGPMQHDDLLRRVGQEVNVVVHPSLDEAFSISALEAMALRKAIIAGATTSGMAEMLESGAGVLTDMRNPAALAEAMFQLALSEDYRRRLADVAFDRAFELYRVRSVADNYEAVYEKLLLISSATSSKQQPRFSPSRTEPGASLDQAMDGWGQ
jgi:glycosyltransferase involved in cell wall biosynthesis